MATARALQPVDMRELNLGDLLFGDVTLSTAGEFRLDYGGGDADVFRGDFGYTVEGLPFGVIESLTATRDGALAFEASGLETSVQPFIQWVLIDDIQSALGSMFAGSDAFSGSDGADWLSAYGGDDRMNGAGGADTLFGGAGSDEIEGDDGDDSISGGDSADRLFGDDGRDNINGNQGNDYVEGGEGDDWLFGGQGTDQIAGEGGDDYFNGNLGADTLDGGDGDDTLRGGQDNDTLFGYDGADWLAGDLGTDMLTGGKGADVFYFGQGFGIDYVRDFNSASGDRIELQKYVPYTIQFDGPDAIINLGNGDMLVLMNVSASELGDWLAD